MAVGCSGCWTLPTRTTDRGVGGGGDLDFRQDLRCSHSGCWMMPALWTLRQLLMDLQTPHQPMLFEGRSPVEMFYSMLQDPRSVNPTSRRCVDYLRSRILGLMILVCLTDASRRARRQSEYHHPKSRAHALLVHVNGEQKSKIQDPRSDSSRSPCKRRS